VQTACARTGVLNSLAGVGSSCPPVAPTPHKGGKKPNAAAWTATIPSLDRHWCPPVPLQASGVFPSRDEHLATVLTTRGLCLSMRCPVRCCTRLRRILDHLRSESAEPLTDRIFDLSQRCFGMLPPPLFHPEQDFFALVLATLDPCFRCPLVPLGSSFVRSSPYLSSFFSLLHSRKKMTHTQ
jgi:hypothetical protein